MTKKRGPTKQKERCAYASKYKAKRPPKCGCKACLTKFSERLAEMPPEEFKLEYIYYIPYNTPED